MARTGEDWRPDFEQAMGETFGEAVSPPVSFGDASAHECCEVIWAILGYKVTPRILGLVTEEQVVALSRKFGEYFDCESPPAEKIREAITRTLVRWPVGSLDE
ncbi:MAG: hypothetical protein U0796_04860 [Gemmatales bacterium]